MSAFSDGPLLLLRSSAVNWARPLTIDLGREVATFPAFDDPDEVGAVIYAINQSRIKHGLPPHQWDFADLLALGVPRDIAEKVSAQELSDLCSGNGLNLALPTLLTKAI